MCSTTENEALLILLSKNVNCGEIGCIVIEKSTFCRLEVDDDVISGFNVKTNEDYFSVNFEVASIVVIL